MIKEETIHNTCILASICTVSFFESVGMRRFLGKRLILSSLFRSFTGVSLQELIEYRLIISVYQNVMIS